MITLDIVLQLGEFVTNGASSSSDFWNTFWASGIGALSPLVVFFLTIKSQEKKEIKDKQVYRIEKMNFLKNSIKAANSEILLQLECYQQFILNSSDEQYFLPRMDKPALKELDFLSNKINREEFYHAYLSVFAKSEPNKNILIDEYWDLFKCIYVYEENFEKNK